MQNAPETRGSRLKHRADGSNQYLFPEQQRGQEMKDGIAKPWAKRLESQKVGDENIEERIREDDR